MKLIRIPIAGLLPIIKLAFTGDDDLKLYHIAPGTVESMAQNTFEKIIDFRKASTAQAFVVVLGEETIGYIVISKENRILYSFGLQKKYRRPILLAQWFKLICKAMPEFKCYLWNKNTRAINFMVRNGMTVEQVEKKYTVLENK